MHASQDLNLVFNLLDTEVFDVGHFFPESVHLDLPVFDKIVDPVHDHSIVLLIHFVLLADHLLVQLLESIVQLASRVRFTLNLGFAEDGSRLTLHSRVPIAILHFIIALQFLNDNALDYAVETICGFALRLLHQSLQL